MKVLRIPLAALLAFAACTRADPQVGTTVAASMGRDARLVGTWELVSTRITRGDSTLLHARAPAIRSLKLLNATHYSVLTLRDRQFMRAGTAPYALVGDTYTETVDLASGSYTPGRVYSFRIRIDGDTWTTDGGEGGQRFEEVWRRVR